MKSSVVIGDKVFKYKKDALAFYKNILNSYKFGESLNDEHFNDLLDLIEYDESFYEESSIEDQEETSRNAPAETGDEIVVADVRIAKVQFSVKCFEIIHSDSSSCYISYLQMINRPQNNPDSLFNTACRNAVQDDVRAVKRRYFGANSSKGYVKCQETGQMSKWEELVVDHRQPNTFSVIVDRFKEVKQIDSNKIEYIINEKNLLLFADRKLVTEFVSYHKAKANLRIVRKENNLSRTGMARLKQTAKDLKVK